jgi:putative oxidoreductase
MKIAVTISRILMGLIFLIFGLNKFLNFIPSQMPPGTAGQFAGILFTTHYLWIIALIEIACGALLLSNRYVALALTLTGPLVVNILLFHALMAHSGLPIGIVVAICWFVVYAGHRTAFTPLLAQNA